MAIPVARVHLAMAHASLPGLLPTPPKCTMLLPAAPPCAVVIFPSSLPKPSRADAAGRWDAHKIKIKQPGSPPASSSSDALDGKSSSFVRASLCYGSLDSNVKSLSRTSSSAGSNSRADSDERWDAHKTKPAASPSSSASSASSSNKTKSCRISRRYNNIGRGASSAAERWDAHKKPRAPPADELDDGESSTGSNDVEMDMVMPQQTPARSLSYAGPGFITSPEPSMLPMPTFLIRVA